LESTTWKFVKQGLKIRFHAEGCLLRLLPLLQKLSKVLKLHQGFIVMDFQILRLDIDNQKHLLAKMVEGDHLVKEHQVDIAKAFLILCIQL